MNWLAKILNLIPVIAAGVHLFSPGATLESKQQLATDSLQLALQGATVLAAGTADAPLVAGLGELAQTTLTSAVTVLHNSATPAPIAGTV